MARRKAAIPPGSWKCWQFDGSLDDVGPEPQRSVGPGSSAD
ncbi:hypothetical protein V0M98_28330 [Pseudomonas silesiensis]